MKNKITIQDIADRCKVSKACVSRYLNNGYVSQEKGELIQKVIEETGFEQNFFAKRLKQSQSHLIGLTFSRLDSVTVGRTVEGMMEILEEHGYQMLIMVSRLSEKRELEQLQRLAHQGVDGIVMGCMGIKQSHVNMVASLSIPVLFSGQRNPKVPYIKLNDYKAGRMCADYLYDMGHRDILFLGVSENDLAVGIERKTGFFDAFKSKQEKVRLSYFETDFQFKHILTKLKDIHISTHTAIVGATDKIAIAAMRYLLHKGYHIPDDISIMGIGGYDIGEVYVPSLTTISFDDFEMGRVLGSTILALIRKESINEKAGDLVSLTLMERESVKRLNIVDV